MSVRASEVLRDGLKKYKKKNYQSWDSLLQDVQGNIEKLKRDQGLEELVLREGIPVSVRGRIWMILSGIDEKKQNEDATYIRILDTFSGKESEATKQIEKDLKRTFPDNEVFESDEGISALRRVLVAYSWTNPEIGYCQSMNFIAAVLLLFMDEGDAFWLMGVLIEEIIPQDYYSKAMLGVKSDERLWLEILQSRLPKVYNHLQKMDINLTGTIIGWFMSMYINILPLEAALRFLDTLFVEGSIMIFRVGLALFKMNEKAILKEKTFEGLYITISKMASLVDDTDKLFEIALGQSLMGSYKQDKISSRRKHYWTEFRRLKQEENEKNGKFVSEKDLGNTNGDLGTPSDSTTSEEKMEEDEGDESPNKNAWNVTNPDLSSNSSKKGMLGSPRQKVFRNAVSRSQTPPQRSPLRPRQTASEPPSKVVAQRRNINMNRKPIVNSNIRKTSKPISAISAAPPLPGRKIKQLNEESITKGPTRAQISRRVVDSGGMADSRFEDRFRPLSVFFGYTEDNVNLPKVNLDDDDVTVPILIEPPESDCDSDSDSSPRKNPIGEEKLKNLSKSSPSPPNSKPLNPKPSNPKPRNLQNSSSTIPKKFDKPAPPRGNIPKNLKLSRRMSSPVRREPSPQKALRGGSRRVPNATRSPPGTNISGSISPSTSTPNLVDGNKTSQSPNTKQRIVSQRNPPNPQRRIINSQAKRQSAPKLYDHVIVED